MFGESDEGEREIVSSRVICGRRMGKKGWKVLAKTKTK
jgi:hypothetical protein